MGMKTLEGPYNNRWDWLRAKNEIIGKEGNLPYVYVLKGEDKSGMTGGMGVDFGQKDEGDLKRRGIPSDLIKRVSPMLGVKGERGASTRKAEMQDRSSVHYRPNLGPQGHYSPLSRKEIEFFNDREMDYEMGRFEEDMTLDYLDNVDPGFAAEAASEWWRGSLSRSHKTRRMLRKGNYKDAKSEWLRNREYTERLDRREQSLRDPVKYKMKPFDQGIIDRFENFAESIEMEGRRLKKWNTGGLVSDPVYRRWI